MKWFISIFFVLITMTGALTSENAACAAEDMLQGEWLLTAAEIQGSALPAPAGKGGSIVFAKDGKLILKDPGKPDKVGRYKMDAETTPMQLDLIVAKNGKDGEAVRGIYELDGDNLKMCFPADGPKGKRPSEFKGDKVVIMHCKRQK